MEPSPPLASPRGLWQNAYKMCDFFKVDVDMNICGSQTTWNMVGGYMRREKTSRIGRQNPACNLQCGVARTSWAGSLWGSGTQTTDRKWYTVARDESGFYDPQRD